MNSKVILVKDHPDYSNISELAIEELIHSHDTGNRSRLFFKRSLRFYIQVKDRDINSLSDKQKNWLWEMSCVLHDRKTNSEEITISQPLEQIQHELRYEQPKVKISLFQKVIYIIKKAFKLS